MFTNMGASAPQGNRILRPDQLRTKLVKNAFTTEGAGTPPARRAIPGRKSASWRLAASAHEGAAQKSARRGDLARKLGCVSGGGWRRCPPRWCQPRASRRLIEVKTTNGWERTPFHISRNELAVAEERRSEWSLFRLWNFAREPKAFELHPPLDAHVSLTATSFQASFH